MNASSLPDVRWQMRRIRTRRRSRRETNPTSSFLPFVVLATTLFVRAATSFRFQSTSCRSVRNPPNTVRGNAIAKLVELLQEERIDSPIRRLHGSTEARRTSKSPTIVARFAESDSEQTNEKGTDTISKTTDAPLPNLDRDVEDIIGLNYTDDDQMDERNASNPILFFADAESNDTASSLQYVDELERHVLEGGEKNASDSSMFFADAENNNTAAALHNVEEVESHDPNGAVTRRDAFRYGAILSSAVLLTGVTITTTDPSSKAPTSPTVAPSPKLVPVNLTKVASQTNINVTASCENMCVSIDSSNFTFNKVERAKTPDWLPSFLAPRSRVVKKIPNSELLVAATAAGSVMEMVRTGLLYPLQTVKTRLQAERNVRFTGEGPRELPTLEEQMTALGATIRRKIDDGDLYAGISPTLLVSVPATGIYYGVRDVTKRLLFLTPLDATWIAVAGALVGDVVSLCFRVPSDALRVRLQAQNDSAGDWLGDSLRSLPAIILTDLPYLSMKIVLNKSLIQGDMSVSEYAFLAAFASAVAGFLTTPFDVARTRILLDKWSDPPAETTEEEDGIEEGLRSSRSDDAPAAVDAAANPGDSVLRTMIRITEEGDGGVVNLFSGWLERVLYLGIGRAWLEPIQLIGYIGIRDAVLLEWF